MATSQNQENAQSLEIIEPQARQWLQDVKPLVGDKFGIFQFRNQPALVEYHSYAPHSPVPIDLDDRTSALVNKLAGLLHQPKEIVFRTPSC